MRLGMWSAPVLKTSTSAAEHLPVPRRMPHRRQRQRGNMADDSAPTKTPPPLRPSLVRMRKEFGSRDPGFKVGVSGQFTEDDFQPRLITNLADLIAHTACLLPNLKVNTHEVLTKISLCSSQLRISLKMEPISMNQDLRFRKHG